MGGTIRHIFPDVVIAPSAMVAFTDTQCEISPYLGISADSPDYWDISPHIYRFVAASMEQIHNFHTVDERIHLDAHLSTIRFFYKFVQNTIGWQAL
jgi:Gly-Xaa carboxypeptidase